MRMAVRAGPHELRASQHGKDIIVGVYAGDGDDSLATMRITPDEDAAEAGVFTVSGYWNATGEPVASAAYPGKLRGYEPSGWALWVQAGTAVEAAELAVEDMRAQAGEEVTAMRRPASRSA